MNLFFLLFLITSSFGDDVNCNGFFTASSSSINTLTLEKTCTFFIDGTVEIDTLTISGEFGGKVFVNSEANLTINNLSIGQQLLIPN